MAPPFISVICAVRNGGPNFKRLLMSFAEQDFEFKELLVIDGASTDETVATIRKHERHLAYWVSEADVGIFDAWNKGVRKARGEWLCFLGADDQFYDRSAMSRMARVLEGAYPDFRIVYGSVAVEAPSGELLGVLGSPWPEIADAFTYEMKIPHPGTFHHRNVFRDRGLFDVTYRIAGDYEFLRRELPERPALFAKGVKVARFQHGGISNTPRGSWQAMRELRRIREDHGVKLSLRMFASRMRIKATAAHAIDALIGPRGFAKIRRLLRRIGRVRAGGEKP